MRHVVRADLDPREMGDAPHGGGIDGHGFSLCFGWGGYSTGALAQAMRDGGPKFWYEIFAQYRTKMFRGRCAGGGIWPGGMTLNACEEIWFALFVVERIRMSLLRLLLVLVALGAFLASPRDCTLAAEL